ncbi:MAG: signal peptide peptidase SppA [Candidatus Altiarchaeota archaeon]
MKTVWKVVIVVGILGVLGVFGALLGYLAYKSTDLGFGDAVMVVPVKGLITLDACDVGLLSTSSCTTVADVKDALEAAQADPSVKAILLDINSGGGSVVASREMMRIVKASEKPVVSWIGEVGASGAYYVASASDYIVADEDSITGSIGVIMNVMHYYGLMEEVGVNVTVIKAGKTKDIGSPYRPMTDEEQKIMQDMIDKIYVDFTSDVAENRGLDKGFVENISSGQLYLGSEANTLGLIDALGGFDEALTMAKGFGGIEGEPRIIRPEREESFWELINKFYGFKYDGFPIFGYKEYRWINLWAT